MTKFSFILLSGGSTEFLEKIRELGVVDITRSRKPVDEQSEGVLAEVERCRKALRIVDAVDYGKDEDHDKIIAASGKVGKIENPFASVLEGAEKLKELEAEKERLCKLIEKCSPWGSFGRDDIEKIASLGLKLHFHCIPAKKFESEWAEKYPLQVVETIDGNIYFVTVCPEGVSPEIPEIAAPEASSTELQEQLADVQTQIVSAKGLLLAGKSAKQELEDALYNALGSLDFYLAQNSCTKAAGNKVDVFEGFTTAENADNVCEALKDSEVYYLREDATEEDNPPISLKNNKFVKMFEVFTDMYGRPLYNEFDPTPFISIFFLLFFAMCLGDAGYGVILLIAGLALRKQSGFIGKVAPLVATLGVATFCVGVVLHTFFGMDISQAGWVPAWMKKVMVTGTVGGSFDAQMVMSIIIGIVHLCLAMLVKAYNEVRTNGFAASLGTLGWTLFIVGGVVVGGLALTGVIGSEITKWIIIALGSVSAIGIFLLNDIRKNPLINIGSGLWATYNTVTGLLGDVLSYLRLYALGLAGGMLGQAFNTLATMVLGIEVPGLNWICFIIILIIGHTLNIAMSCLGAFVHPLRLNFLEFFKNSGYQGTGRKFKPLAVVTEDE